MRLRTLLTGAAASAIMLATPAAAFASGNYPNPDSTPSGNSQQCGPRGNGFEQTQVKWHKPGCCSQQPKGISDNSKGGWQQGDSCTCSPTWIFVKDPSGRGLWDKNGKYDPRHGKCDRTQQQACECPKGTHDNDGQRGCTPGQRTYTAVTHLTNRPDGGGGGNTWADDDITRTLTIHVSGIPGHYTDTATITDTGTFVTILGSLTPDQGGIFHGDTIHRTRRGTLSGGAQYSFTSAALPSVASNLGVPRHENGAPVTTPETTSSWYEQAFGGTTAGVGIGHWSWTYSAPGQQWTDAWDNGDGQLPADGNIS